LNTAPIISKVWSFCTTLRDDGVSYGDYLEQLTYLIFLKMADEYAKPPYNRAVVIPDGYDWQSLKSKRGAELEGHYIELLRELATRKGMLGQIFTKAQNKIQDLTYNRQDFWATTSNKQLNFVQPIRTLLKSEQFSGGFGPSGQGRIILLKEHPEMVTI
jgi:type I restriction-modification system DNA methylase subunit